MKTLIIGGVAGGASCAARLRRLDEKAEIVILERGEFISFANCGLPYYIGGEITEKSNLTLQTPESFKARFNIEVRTFSEAVAIDTENKTVTVKDLKTGEEYDERYDSLVLSPGASPIRPRIDGIDSDRVFTLRNIPDTMKIKQYIDENHPKSAVVVGGGYIGVEMAENLANAGLDVTIVELSDHLINPLDFDMAADVHRYIKSKGIKLALGNGVFAITDSDNGLTVELNRGIIDTDMVLLSVGVRPDTAFIKSAGIETNERGSIIVNEKMQTSAPDVYAVGDAVAVKNFVTGEPSFIPLAGPANKQGRIAADNIGGIPSEYKGAKVTDLAELELCYAPPFGSAKDPVNMVGFVAENVITGKIGQFFWHDVEKLPRDGSITLLDTRTATEVARGRIDGFMHIPLDSLRERMGEIPTGKPVYVHCHSGLRSYIACRILAGNGFECYNLAGGWRLYESVINERTEPEYVCTECK